MNARTVFTSAALAQDFNIDWFSIDGGGIMFAAGGDFELGGTLGQHDAGPPAPMTGGDFALTGGFWTAAGVGELCAEPGDMNLDGSVDGDDIQPFIDCLFGGGGANCPCADLNGNGIDSSDVTAFVALLLES